MGTRALCRCHGGARGVGWGGRRCPVSGQIQGTEVDARGGRQAIPNVVGSSSTLRSERVHCRISDSVRTSGCRQSRKPSRAEKSRVEIQCVKPWSRARMPGCLATGAGSLRPVVIAAGGTGHWTTVDDVTNSSLALIPSADQPGCTNCSGCEQLGSSEAAPAPALAPARAATPQRLGPTPNHPRPSVPCHGRAQQSGIAGCRLAVLGPSTASAQLSKMRINACVCSTQAGPRQLSLDATPRHCMPVAHPPCIPPAKAQLSIRPLKLTAPAHLARPHTSLARPPRPRPPLDLLVLAPTLEQCRSIELVPRSPSPICPACCSRRAPSCAVRQASQLCKLSPTPPAPATMAIASSSSPRPLAVAVMLGLLSSTAAAATANYTVHSSVIFARTGEHTPFLSGDSIVTTSYGSRQMANLVRLQPRPPQTPTANHPLHRALSSASDTSPTLPASTATTPPP